jgi:hypothetical protein
MNDFIPNSFQTPNAYVDRYMAFLTPEEWKVLTYMGRRIFGFNKREDNISCSQIMNGITAKDGHQLDYGTGLGEAATKNAIKNLIAFRLVIEVAPNNAHENKGPKYALQLDSSLVNDELIMERHNKKTGRENERMEKARAARQSNKPGSNGQTPAYPLEQTPPYPIEGGDALLDKAHNTQGNPGINTDGSSSKAEKVQTPPVPPEPPEEPPTPYAVFVGKATKAYPVLAFSNCGQGQELGEYFDQYGEKTLLDIAAWMAASANGLTSMPQYLRMVGRKAASWKDEPQPAAKPAYASFNRQAYQQPPRKRILTDAYGNQIEVEG